MDIDVDSLLKGFETVAKGTNAADKAWQLVEKIRQKVSQPEKGKASDKPDDELTGMILELKNEITDVKLANIDLKEQVIDLRSALLQILQTERNFERYELVETQNQNFVYRLKEEDANGERVHYICPKCKEDGEKSILQGNQYYKTCPECKNGYNFADPPNSGSMSIDFPF